MILVRPYDDLAAHAVLSRLDPADQREVDLSRGAPTAPLALFADWRAMQAVRYESHVALTGGTPFAVFALANAGYSGVASVALLARDHARFRRPLATLCTLIRAELPARAEKYRLTRLEARSWSAHPTGARLLTAMGFRREADLPGFGIGGSLTFPQFARVFLFPIHLGQDDPHPDQPPINPKE